MKAFLFKMNYKNFKLIKTKTISKKIGHKYWYLYLN